MRIGSLFDKWGSRGSTIATFWPILVPSGIVGVISGYLARGAEAINQYGTFGWWAVGLIATLATSATFALAAYALHRFNLAKAARLWTKTVETINPLDAEFTRRRIKIVDLVSPAEKEISNKRFIDCELVGPATIIVLDSRIGNAGFINCDMVAVKENIFTHAIRLRDVEIYGGKLIDMTIYLLPGDRPQLEGLRPYYISLTGDAAIDSRMPTDTVQGKQR